MLYIGLPQWQHSGWGKYGLHTLADYARHFNCVEGNTTLYALPDAGRVRDWGAMTPETFRFCLVPRHHQPHQGGLRHFQAPLATFFALAPLADRIGQYWLQLPVAFSPADLENLWTFLDALPADFHYGVEVRHPAFFTKQDEERTLNRGLQQRGVNRVILDSRPVHAALPTSSALRAAQQQKPRLPVHAVVTADRSLVRFIGADDPDNNVALFQPWLARLPDWLQWGTPFLFIHTPDIGYAPPLAQRLWPKLAAEISAIGPTLHWPQQETLF
ncbi:MAG: DUF72 domain-containing protein [Sodalis sp. (in: enterobacteria)]|uniref:DUF72 domain-containing protein n=1 Tax=Sodalis sp. (in: enterobacteria) TaxID=1898979 RepID=UPI003F39B378